MFNINNYNTAADVEMVSRISVMPTILEVICRTTGMGFAAVARVTEDSWVACSVRDEIDFGLKVGGELQIETTICHEIRQSGKEVVIDHVELDPIYATHHTPAMYGFQSYISVPINRKDGTLFGTLCAIDPRPAKLNNPQIIGMFRLYADLISFHLNAIEQLAFTETKLSEERKNAELREQFIAILGHDLRNPVNAVSNSAQLLMLMSADEKVQKLANIIKNSSYRMTGLIENILDFARGRLGGGISLNVGTGDSLENMLNQVISELQTISPNIQFEKKFDLQEPVECDEKRIQQLFSNLLGNAATHGKTSAPIIINAVSKDEKFELAVINSGNKIPDAAMEHLFKPFSRGDIKPGQQGLGLGLYIASEIAQAHGGTIEVSSTEAETCFTFSMPAKKYPLQ